MSTFSPEQEKLQASEISMLHPLRTGLNRLVRIALAGTAAASVTLGVFLDRPAVVSASDISINALIDDCGPIIPDDGLEGDLTIEKPENQPMPLKLPINPDPTLA